MTTKVHKIAQFNHLRQSEIYDAETFYLLSEISHELKIEETYQGRLELNLVEVRTTYRIDEQEEKRMLWSCDADYKYGLESINKKFMENFNLLRECGFNPIGEPIQY